MSIYIIICTVVYTKMYQVAAEHMYRIHGLKFEVLKKDLHRKVNFSYFSQDMQSRSTTASSLRDHSHRGNQTTATSKMLAEPIKDDEIKVFSESDAGGDNHGQNNRHSNEPDNKSQQKCKGRRCEDCINIKIARMTFLVLIILIFCWLPFLVINIIKSVHSDQPSPWQHWMFEVTVELLYCNSFMNPILYSWQNSDFRNAFKVLLSKPCARKTRRPIE